MTDLGFYEKVIKACSKKKTLFRKSLTVAVFVIACIVWVLIALYANLSPAIILIVIAIFLGAAASILHYIYFEYEYSITESEVTLAKIYGKSRRSEIFSAYSESVLLIAPKTDLNMKKVADLKPEHTFEIYDPNTTSKLWLIVFQNQKDKNVLFVFEADDDAVKVLKNLKPSVMIYR